jgi:hypothetical protein
LKKGTLGGNAMPVSKDQYPLQLLAQARTALLAWYTKELKKELSKKALTEEDLAERVRQKVRWAMRVQFGAERERIAALPDQTRIGQGSRAPVLKIVATKFRMLGSKTDAAPEVEAPYVAMDADIPFRIKHGVDAKTR